MQATLSTQIGRLFWDMDPTKLGVKEHAKTIIERVLNYGTLADWRWLVKSYGGDEVRRVAAARDRFGRTNVRPQASRLVSLLVK
jgi:hypothetical protein